MRTVFRDSRRRHGHDQGIAWLEEETMVNALEKRFPGKPALDEAAA
jgi:hypothetical protein